MSGLVSGIPPGAPAYAAPSLVAAFAVQTWFSGGAGLATGDLVPPVAPGGEYRAHWNGFDTGAGAPSYQIVSLPYFEGLRLFSWLGLGEVAFQRVWLTLLVAGTAAAVVFLARGLVRSRLAAAVAGFVPLLSAYRLTLAFDAVPLMAMIAAAVLGGLVIRAGGEEGPRPVVFGLASLCCAFVALNPPHLALVVGWIVVCAALAWAAHGRQAPGRLARFLLAAVPLALLLNLWWIVPAAMTLTGPVFTDRFAAAGVDEWAWTHARGHLLNVIAFTSNWAWPHREYFPFSAGLERAPFTVLQYSPALAAALGMTVALTGRRRGVALVLGVVALLAIWVMKGLHYPLAGTNRWLYDHMPGFWLLRDPVKTGLVLVLAFALLTALGVSWLAERSRQAAAVAAVLVVLGAAAYAHPLLTGAVVPTERPLLPSAHVSVPAGWQATADYLEDRPEEGKIVVLPRLDYYQTPTTWGYYGASFMHQLIGRTVIEPLPAAYYRDPVVDSLVARLQSEILRGGADVTGLLQALGAKFVLLRRDLDATFPGRSLVPADVLARSLARTEGLRRARGFGPADVYEAPDVRTPEVYPALPLRADEASARRAVPMPADAALVDDPPDGIPSGEARVVSPTHPGKRLALEVDRDAVVAWQLDAAASVPLATLPTPAPPFDVLAGSTRNTVRDSPDRSRHIGIPGQGDLAEGRRMFPPEPIELRPGLENRVGDCNRYDDRSLRDVGISAEVIGDRGRATLRLRAREHAACVSIPVAAARAGQPLRIELSYRGRSGNPPRLCVWQVGPERCAELPPLDASPGWHRLRETVTVDAGTQAVRLFVYADGDAARGRATRTEYRRLRVATRAPELGVAVLPRTGLPHVSYRRTAPGEFRVRIRGADGPFLLVAAETFAPGWRLEAPDRDGSDVVHVRVNGYANAWRIPWTGSYELTISYGPERLAEVARRLDLLAIPLAVVAFVAGSLRRRRR